MVWVVMNYNNYHKITMCVEEGKKNKVLKKRALRINQNDGNPLYVFSLTGTELLEIGDIVIMEQFVNA